MSIAMQGAWTVSVKGKSAAYPQRFVISGADIGNGTYPGETTTAPVFVSGAQWSLRVEHNPTGPVSWIPSAERITFPTLSAGQVRFDIRSNDSGGDLDYNDLVLTCSTPASPADYVVYGTAKSYAGLCKLNPCKTFPWAVIDSPRHLRDLLRYAPVRDALRKLYPERIYPYLERRRVVPPRPEPDPTPFIPLMLPLAATATRDSRDTLPQSMNPASAAGVKDRLEDAQTARVDVAGPVRFATQSVELGAVARAEIAPYALEIARIKDILAVGCKVKNQPGLLLRFQEYDRTVAELTGGPYTGTGHRQPLGHAVTDEQGNYVFRFTQTLEDVAAETSDVLSDGTPLATQLRPDLIVQVVSGGTDGVLYESALHPDVPNLKRIDLCVPEHVLNLGPSACQGGRAIQAVGNIWTIAGVGNTLDADGRITATNPTGPQIVRGAWVGRLDFFACFLDRPEVKYYTIRFRRPDGAWSFVQELYTHIKIADIGLPNYTGTKVGPDTRSLAVGGGAKVNAPSYVNIESDADWVATHRLRKVQLSSAIYESALYGPDEGPRTVEFRIEGYTDAGDKVAGAEDSIRLLIDNRPIAGDIASIAMGTLSPGECALFELPAANTALTTRFKAHHPGGFVQSYTLDVIRGSSAPVTVTDTSGAGQPLSPAYSPASHGDFFFGTFNGVSPDADLYVVAELQPTGGSWLASGQNFCAFAFRLAATPRTTNGYGLTPGGYLNFELVGISHTAAGS